MAPRDHPRPSVVILVADGARPDTLASAIDAGELPAMNRLRAEGGLYTVSSVFPSVTGPAYVPFLTGQFPGAAGLPGIRWYDRARTRTRWPAYSRSYVHLDMLEMSRDLDPNRPTLFELAGSRVAGMSVIERGLRRREKMARGFRFASRAIFAHFTGSVGAWLDIDADIGDKLARHVAAQRPDIAYCAFTGADKTSHGMGHDAPIVRKAMQIVDRTAARIRSDAERDGRWDQMHLWIVSDHGHSPVTAHEDLAGLLRTWGVRVRAHPWTVGIGHRAAVMVSGNAMAHVYLDIHRRDRPWWPALASRWDWLAERLLGRDSCDLLLLPVDAATTEIRAHGRGLATITVARGRYSYLPETGDPLGIGELHNLDADDAHAATIASDYPDALVQIADLAASPRCGDLLISASRNWDLRSGWEPIPHVSSHGALHREHMLVPLLVNRPPTRPPMRTVDVFATASSLIGASARNEGRSWLP